jgi:hypothetical protein
VSEETIRAEPRFSFIGVGLIFVGLILLLKHLDLFDIRWSKLIWPALSILGLWIAARGFALRRRSSVFTGSVLFFVCLFVALKKFDILRYDMGDWIPAVSLSIGLAFLALLVLEPRNIIVIVPMVVFGGFGVMYYLWWMDIMNGYEMRRLVKLYWPLLLIIWGAAFLIPRRIRIQ